MKTPRKKPESATGPSSIVDWPEVNRVLEFMTQHELEEFEFTQGDLRIHLRKPAAGSGAVIPFAPPPSPTVVPAPAPAPGGGVVVAAGTAGPGEEGLHIVKSPIVGTFYASSNPASPPFVKAGDQIVTGQVLCIVEAMKLMNEIESDVAGELVRVLVENGQAVEYGQALFAIRPSKRDS
ncbi:MAG: acetyl-CoA carboxylase biotin carboxyl carrier protein [Candidatus Acidiferrales bacterium]